MALTLSAAKSAGAAFHTSLSRGGECAALETVLDFELGFALDEGAILGIDV